MDPVNQSTIKQHHEWQCSNTAMLYHRFFSCSADMLLYCDLPPPIELLTFVDRKVEDSIHGLERHVPERVKEVYTTVQKAPELVRSVAGKVQKAGVVGTAAGIAKGVYGKFQPAAKELYVKYEPVVEQYAVTAWRSLNQVPLFPQVAQIVVPTASCLTKKYNQTVGYGAERGYAVSAYLPIVPTEKIAKLFSNVDHAPVE